MVLAAICETCRVWKHGLFADIGLAPEVRQRGLLVGTLDLVAHLLMLSLFRRDLRELRRLVMKELSSLMALKKLT